MYDFDKTPSPGNMQEYAFIEGLGMTPAAFWSKCEELQMANNMDPILRLYVLYGEGKPRQNGHNP